MESQARERDYGEESWIYFLYGTRPPYFNPITLDHPGIESKLTGWFLWRYRIRGIAYYSLNNWGSNPWTDPMTSGHNGDTFMLYPPSESNQAIVYGSNNHRLVPSIRFELMRDSLEDYEYLYLLGGGQPQVGLGNAADAQVEKIISGLTSYTRNSEFHLQSTPSYRSEKWRRDRHTPRSSATGHPSACARSAGQLLHQLSGSQW